MRWVVAAVLGSSVVGCATEPAAPPEPPKPTCDLTADTLPDKTFVLATKDENDKWTEDITARARFFSENGKLKVRYNAKAATDMYTYTCVPGEKEITCWEDDPKAADFCRSLIANKGDGACTVEEVVKMTGLSTEAAQKGVDEVMEELKKLPPKELADMKALFNSPNIQLRGILHITIREDECRLTITDNYMTMSFGTVREMQNVVGAGRFVRSDKDLFFEHCTDDDNLVALKDPTAKAQPKETVGEWTVGASIPFRYVGPDEQKPQEGCTYSLDAWSQYEPVGKGRAVQVDAEGNLDWSFQTSFPTTGIKVVHMVRHRACEGKPAEQISLSCQGVRIK